MRNGIVPFAAAVAALAGLAGCGQGLATSQLRADPAFKTVTNGDFELRYRINGDHFDAFVSCTTSGWVALGLNAPRGMSGSDIKIGYADRDGAHLRDDYGTSRRAHASDVSLGGKDDITNATATEANGRTEIGFTIPLSSSDRYDGYVLAAGQSEPIILGCGKDGAKDFTTIHKKVAGMTITL